MDEFDCGVARHSQRTTESTIDILSDVVWWIRTAGASTESGLGEAEFDSDRELEAIRGSVRSLRAQRMAVEQLKDKARHEERTVEVLKHKLREAEEEIEDLRAQGGRDVVRRLMDEVRAS